IVLREHAADDVFVDLEAKDARNFLRNAGTASAGIAALEFDDRVDEFLRWAFWTGPSMTSREKKPMIFAFLERLVESQQGLGFQDDGKLGKPADRDEQRCKAQNEAIGRIQVRCPPPRSTTDEQLLLQQQGFSHDGAYSAGAHELGDCGQQMDGEYEQVNHRHRR